MDYNKSFTSTASTSSLAYAAEPDVGIKYSLQHRVGGRLNTMRKSPVIILIFLAFFAIVTALGVTAIVYYVKIEEEIEYDTLTSRLLHEVIPGIENALQDAGGGASAMALYTRTIVLDNSSTVPTKDRFEDGFVDAAQAILKWLVKNMFLPDLMIFT